MSTTDRSNRWPLFLVGAVLALLGLVLAVGGIRLLWLGGSSYYLVAGVGLVVSGVLMILRQRWGAGVFAVVFIGTVIWALWEVGLSFWGHVPRLALLVVLAMAVALVSPRLDGGPTVRTGRRTAGVLALVFVAAVAWAFAPHNVYRAPVDESGSARIAAGVRSSSGEGAAGEDWVAYGGSNAATRYSTLNLINRENVHRLERAWVYRTGDMPIEGERKWGAETTPLKIGDTVYLCSAMNKLIALDATTGEERWRFDPKVGREYIPYTAACRGVAFHEAPALADDAPCKRRVIEGTLDARLIAVDASTGVPCPDFGNQGQVSLLTGMGEVLPAMVAVTSPPTIVRGIAVVGHQVLDGQYRNAPSGVIRGYDAVTGELAWAWDMLRPNEKGLPPEGETYSRGTPNAWTLFSGDEALGLVYVPMGNSSADYFSGTRTPTENKFNTSVVALDVTTGDVRWSFQTVHIDVWDYDLGSQPTLFGFPTEQGSVPALLLATKQGDIYVLDRATGRPLTPVEMRPAPSGGVDGNVLSPMQPHSTGMPVLRRPDLTERDMWGLTPIDQLYCRIQYREADYEGLYTPPSLDRRWIQWPGYNGGNDWGSVSIDVDRGVLVANYNNVPMYNQLLTREEANRRGLVALGMPGGSSESSGPQPMIGTPFAADIAPWRVKFTKLLCNDPPYGSITTIDLRTRRVIWTTPLGTARRNGPFGLPTYLPIAIGTPNNGGPVTTAGGLIFIAAATDDLIRAIDVDTGEVLWSDALPAGGQATPMTYEAGGQQYVLMMAGGHHFMETPAGDFVIAYRLRK